MRKESETLLRNSLLRYKKATEEIGRLRRKSADKGFRTFIRPCYKSVFYVVPKIRVPFSDTAILHSFARSCSSHSAPLCDGTKIVNFILLFDIYMRIICKHSVMVGCYHIDFFRRIPLIVFHR